MVNLLMFGKNIHKLKRMFNKIISNNEDIRVDKIITDKEEAITILNSDNKIDIVIMDSSDESVQLLKNIDENKYINSVLMIIKDFSEIESIINNKVIFDYILKGSNISKIKNKISKLVLEKNIKDKRKKIVKELKYIGYNLEYVGTNYLIEAILQMYENKGFGLDNLQRDIYPKISKNCNKSVHNIKCNITRATDCMFFECDSKRLQEYFGVCEDYKPTAKMVMYTVLNKLL